MGICAVCVAVGFVYRLAITLLFLIVTYIFLIDQACYLNHMYLVSLFALLMIFMPAHRAASIDSWLIPSLRSDLAPSWCTWLLRFQLAIVYAYAAIAKLTPDWLAGNRDGLVKQSTAAGASKNAAVIAAFGRSIQRIRFIEHRGFLV